MKKLALWTILIACTQMFGCGNTATGDLEIIISSPEADIIPAGAYSCKALASVTPPTTSDVTAPTFTVPRTKVRWHNAYQKLTLVQVRIFFNSTHLGGKFECDIADDELVAAGGQSGSPVVLNNSKHDPTLYTEFQFPCQFKCGGLNPEDVDFTASGTIEMVGFSTDGDDVDHPVRASTSFSVQNIVD